MTLTLTLLWDKELEEYKCRNSVTSAWRDICCSLNDNFEDLSDKEKNEFGKFLRGLKAIYLTLYYKKLNEKDRSVRSREKNLLGMLIKYILIISLT